MRAFTAWGSAISLTSTTDNADNVVCMDASNLEDTDLSNIPPLPFQAGNSAVLALEFIGYSDDSHTLVLQYQTNDDPAGSLTDGLPAYNDDNWVTQLTVYNSAASAPDDTNPVATPVGASETGASFTMYFDTVYIGEYIQLLVSTAASGSDDAGSVIGYFLSN